MVKGERNLAMKRNVKSGALLISLLLMVLLMASISFAKEPVIVTLRGEIMDSQCAFDVHSTGHTRDAMAKQGDCGTDGKTGGARRVKENGEIYVVAVKDDVHKLHDQAQPEIFPGREVKGSVTIDEK